MIGTEDNMVCSHLAQDAKQSQEANVPTRNSSLCWQFGEISAHWQQPFVHD